MIKILFLCHGNICRSPMAEYVMKDLVKKSNLSDQFHIPSAATSTEEIGNPVHRGTRAKLAQAGIACEGHHARQMTRADYDGYDYLIGMDEWNIRNIKRITGGDPEGKIFKMMSFAGSSRDVADPWYTGDFEATWKDVTEGCQGLLQYILEDVYKRQVQYCGPYLYWTYPGKRSTGTDWCRRVHAPHHDCFRFRGPCRKRRRSQSLYFYGKRR